MREALLLLLFVISLELFVFLNEVVFPLLQLLQGFSQLSLLVLKVFPFHAELGALVF